MYHSLILTTSNDVGAIGYMGLNPDINTWDDWHLIPSTRPVVNPPSVKTYSIDIPGSNGKIDMSEFLTKYPLYNNRTGSWDFIVDNGHEEWYEIYSKISGYLHGKERVVILEDDQMWYYQGRLSVNSWKSEQHNSKITIDYDLYPYKRSRALSNNEWLWNPFNFESGIIYRDLYGDIVIEGSKTLTLYGGDGVVGNEPILPAFTFAPSVDGETLQCMFTNYELGIYNYAFELERGTTSLIDPNVTISNSGGKNTNRFIFTGNGHLSIDFRIGRL